MGGKGSGRKPSAVTMLAHGRGGQVVDVPAVDLRVPAGTPKPAAAIYRRLVRDLRAAGILADVDAPLLAQLATALWLNQDAAAALARDGAVYADPAHGGRLAKHPAFQVWRDTAATVRSLSALFGLSPADRQRLVGFGGESAATTFVDVLRGVIGADDD